MSKCKATRCPAQKDSQQVRTGCRCIPNAVCAFSSWPCSICSRKTLWFKIFLHHFREKEGSEAPLTLLSESRTGSDRLGPGGSLLSLLFSSGRNRLGLGALCCLSCSPRSHRWNQNPANTEGRAYRLDNVLLNGLKAEDFLKFWIYIFPSFPLEYDFFCCKGQHKFHIAIEDIFIQTIKRKRLD